MSTPEATVTNYYSALGLQHFTQADRYLAPGTRSVMSSAIDSPAANLVSLTKLKVNASQTIDAKFLPGLPPGVSVTDYDSFASATAEYDATFRRVVAEQDGPLIRFLYLGRLRQGGQWQILTIGSGP